MKETEYEAAKKRADSLGLTFSAYVNSLIRRDMREGGSLVVMEEAAQYQVPRGRPPKKAKKP